MGKSLKNGISPDDIYAAYGADTLRLYEMAMGPLDGDRPWHTDDIAGMHRFLQRLWRLIVDEATGADPPSAPRTRPPPCRRPRRRGAGRGHRAAAAPDDRHGPGGLRRAAVQHRDRAADRADRARLPAAARTARPGRAAGPDGGAAGPAHRRGTVAAAGAPAIAGLRAVPAGRSRAGRHDQRDAAGPGQRQGALHHRGARLRPASRTSPTCWPATPPTRATNVARLVIVPGKIVNIVLR